MRFSSDTLAALAVLAPLAIAQVNTDDLSMCVIDCGDQIGGCSINGEDSGCYCHESRAKPDKDAAECLRDCAEDAGLDWRKLYRQGCDPVFEALDDDDDDDNDDDSSGSSGSPSASESSESPSESNGSSSSDNDDNDGDDDGDDDDAAAALGAPVFLAVGGAIAAVVL